MRSECALVKMINFDWAVRIQGMVTKPTKVKMAADSNKEMKRRNSSLGLSGVITESKIREHLLYTKEKVYRAFTKLQRKVHRP